MPVSLNFIDLSVLETVNIGLRPLNS